MLFIYNTMPLRRRQSRVAGYKKRINSTRCRIKYMTNTTQSSNGVELNATQLYVLSRHVHVV